jgi:hypothetical protein
VHCNGNSLRKYLKAEGLLDAPYEGCMLRGTRRQPEFCYIGCPAFLTPSTNRPINTVVCANIDGQRAWTRNFQCLALPIITATPSAVVSLPQAGTATLEGLFSVSHQTPQVSSLTLILKALGDEVAMFPAPTMPPQVAVHQGSLDSVEYKGTALVLSTELPGLLRATRLAFISVASNFSLQATLVDDKGGQDSITIAAVVNCQGA